jgi:hypothetical protein
MGSLKYTIEESQYLEDNWGVVSTLTIAKNLNRPMGGLINKKGRLGLGAFLDNGEYITVHQLFKAIGRSGGNEYTLEQWTKKGFPVKKKRVHACSFNIIYLNEFWKWAKEYRMHINFNKFKENALGAEPEWVKDQRSADIAFAKYKLTPWTTKEDNHLKSLLKLYKYNYKQLSYATFRTEGAIKRRMIDLKIKERPLRENYHSIWTNDQVDIVIKMYYKGYRSEVIKDYIDKSALAIGGRIERLIKDELLVKWK